MKNDFQNYRFRTPLEVRVANVLSFHLPKKMFFRQEFEQAHKLEIVYEDRDCYTDFSRRAFVENRAMIGPPVRVLLVEMCENRALTYIVDEQNRALLFRGFRWGYGGEGPRGLKWLFSQIGFAVEMHALPKVHVFGAWEVRADGHVNPADFMNHYEFGKWLRGQFAYSSDSSAAFFMGVAASVSILLLAVALTTL